MGKGMWRAMCLACMAMALPSGAASAAAGDQVVRIAIINSLGYPLAKFSQDGEAVESGIVKDLSEAVVKEAGFTKWRWMPMPRKRQTQISESGEVDLVCYQDRKWLAELDGTVWWSGTLFESSDVLVGQARMSEKLRLAAGLEGAKALVKMRVEKVGSNLGYSYPSLDDAARMGWMIARDDASSEMTNLQRVDRGRIDYTISQLLVVQNYLKSNEGSGLAKEYVVLDRQKLECYAPKAAKATGLALMEAAARLKSSGAVEKILAKYR